MCEKNLIERPISKTRVSSHVRSVKRAKFDDLIKQINFYAQFQSI